MWVLFTLICCVCTMTILNVCVMLSYCLGRYWAAPVTFKIESGYLSQERNFPCPCESAVAKAASVCVPGKICKFSHLPWNCILINWRSCSDFLIVLRFLKHSICFLLFFFSPHMVHHSLQRSIFCLFWDEFRICTSARK